MDSLTNDEVKSHLQKYWLYTRRPSPLPSSPSPHAPRRAHSHNATQRNATQRHAPRRRAQRGALALTRGRSLGAHALAGARRRSLTSLRPSHTRSIHPFTPWTRHSAGARPRWSTSPRTIHSSRQWLLLCCWRAAAATPTSTIMPSPDISVMELALRRCGILVEQGA